MKDRLGECVDSSSRSRARNEIGKRFPQIAKKVLETRGPLATTLIAYVVSAQLQSFKNQNQPRAADCKLHFWVAWFQPTPILFYSQS